MAQFETAYYATLTEVTDPCGKDREEEWRKRHFGYGLLILFKSEYKMPGKTFVCFYKEAPGELIPPYFRTSPGEQKIQGNNLFLTTRNSCYTFRLEQLIPESKQKKIKDIYREYFILH